MRNNNMQCVVVPLTMIHEVHIIEEDEYEEIENIIRVGIMYPIFWVLSKKIYIPRYPGPRNIYEFF